MPSAILNILVQGGAEARRVFGQIAGESKKASAAMGKAAQDTARTEKKALDETVKAAYDAANKRLQKENELKQKLGQLAEETTRKAKAEGAYRSLADQDEARQRKQLLTAALAEFRRAEVAKTAAMANESRRRVAMAEQEGRNVLAVQRRVASAVSGGLSTGGRAAWQMGSALYSAGASTRERVAAQEMTLATAMTQAGAGSGDIGNIMRQFQRHARAHGLDMSDLAATASAAQQEFTVFGTANTNAADRGRNTSRFLEDYTFGRNVGVDPSQMVRLGGMLSNVGLQGEDRESLMRYAAGAAQHGAVSLGEVSRRGMQGMQARMSAAMGELGPNATSAERQSAAAAAFRQAYAEIQVLHGQGVTTGRGMNTLAQMNRMLAGEHVSDMMLNNVRRHRGSNSALESTLFEADPTRQGHMRLRTHDALTLSAQMMHAGMSTSDIENVFGAGGHGSPAGLRQNFRTILGQLGGVNAEGQHGYEAIMAMMQPGTALTHEQVRRSSDLFEHLDQSTLNSEQTQRDQALGDNTGAVQELTRTISAFAANNPILSTIAGAGGASLVGGAVSKLGGSVAGGLVRGIAGGAAGAGAGTVATWLGAGLASFAAGGLVGGGFTELFSGGGRNSPDSIFRGHTYTEFAQDWREMFGGGIRDNRFNGSNAQGHQVVDVRIVGMDGHAAALTSAQGANTTTPPESRNHQ